MSDYQDILTKSWDEVPELQLLPTGSYLLACRGASMKPPATADKSPQVLFIYEPIEAMDDVDSVAMSKLGPNYDITANRIFHRIFLKDGADIQRLRVHLAKHGVSLTGMTVEASLKAIKGQAIVGLVQTRNYTNNAGEAIEENVIASFAEQT